MRIGVELFDAFRQQVYGAEFLKKELIYLGETLSLLPLERIYDPGDGAARDGGEHFDVFEKRFAVVLQAVQIGHRSQVERGRPVAATGTAQRDGGEWGAGYLWRGIHGMCLATQDTKLLIGHDLFI